MNRSTLRRGAPAALALSFALLLGACGSDGSTGDATPGTSADGNCVDGSIKASGSSAQANAMTEWINAYQTNCEGATIDYQPVGSGAGVQDFINNQVAFAGSDSALKPGEESDPANARCGTGPAINIPMVGGAIAIGYSLEGVDTLITTPEILAGIFSDTITKWDDPAIAAANPGVTLPSDSIVAFHRSDESGTTDNFTKYLAANVPDIWTFEVGKAWTAPGGQGAKGSDGVAAAIKSTPNSIGYIELSFIQSQSLQAAEVDNGGGPVAPTAETAATTLDSSEITGSGDDLILAVDYTETTAGAYPIVLVTYEIVCQTGLPADQLGLTKSFLTFTASADGQSTLTEIGYVPITGELLTKVQAAVASIS